MENKEIVCYVAEVGKVGQITIQSYVTKWDAFSKKVKTFKNYVAEVPTIEDANTILNRLREYRKSG